MTGYGPRNPNYRHGNYSRAPEVGEFKVAMAKDLLIRVFTEKCGPLGKVSYTNEEALWALKVLRERPEWARETLKNLGFDDIEGE